MLHILFFRFFIQFSRSWWLGFLCLEPRLPTSSFDDVNPRFGSGTMPLVGSNGLEPSTSRLSGVRSNHLSYEPISVAGSFPIGQTCWWRRTESNCRPPACKAGALPAELRPRIRFVPLGKSTLLSSLRGPSKLNSVKLTRQTHIILVPFDLDD